jgi:hypothetical protein
VKKGVKAECRAFRPIRLWIVGDRNQLEQVGCRNRLTEIAVKVSRRRGLSKSVTKRTPLSGTGACEGYRHRETAKDFIEKGFRAVFGQAYKRVAYLVIRDLAIGLSIASEIVCSHFREKSLGGIATVIAGR